jgi:hypothetical protein
MVCRVAKGGGEASNRQASQIADNDEGCSRKSGADGRLVGMNFRKALVVVLVGLGCAAVARAQVGIYGTYSASRMSGIDCYSTAPVQCTSGAAGGTVDPITGAVIPAAKGSVNPSGIQGGIYYDFKTFGPVRLGLDLRGGVGRSNKSAALAGGGKNYTTSNLFLAGVRGSFKTRYSFLTPYVQLSAGYDRSNAANPTREFNNFVQYEAFAGVDIHVFPVLDLRPVELGIGNMNRIGEGQGASSVGVKTIAAGIVIHLPSK